MKVGKGHLAFITVLGCIMLCMGYCIVFGDRGLLHLQKLRVQLSTLHRASNELLENNMKLTHEIELLKNNPRYIEKIAREELGLAKTNEIVYKRLKD